MNEPCRREFLPLIPYRKDGGHGYKNLAGRVVVPPRHDYTTRFREGVGQIKARRTELERTIFVDHEGKATGQIETADCMDCHEGLISFRDGHSDLSGYATAEGRIAIEPRYEIARDFRAGTAAVELDGKYGLIDPGGHWILPPAYRNVIPPFVGEEILCVSLDCGKATFFDTCGRRLTGNVYDWTVPPSGGLAPFGRLGGEGRKYGVMDVSGEVVVEPRYDAIESWVVDGVFAAAIATDGNLFWGLATLNGDWAMPPTKTWIGASCEGLRKVYFGGWQTADGEITGGKFGYIDGSQEVVIEPVFDEAGDFEEGFATVDIYLEECPALVDGSDCSELHDSRTGLLTKDRDVYWTSDDSRSYADLLLDEQDRLRSRREQ